MCLGLSENSSDRMALSSSKRLGNARMRRSTSMFLLFNERCKQCGAQGCERTIHDQIATRVLATGQLRPET